MSDDWLDREEDLAVSNLGRLIARMALDDELHRKFLDDPDQVIAAAGLSAEEEKALRGGDWNVIKQYLGPRPRPLHQEDGGP